MQYVGYAWRSTGKANGAATSGGSEVGRRRGDKLRKDYYGHTSFSAMQNQNHYKVTEEKEKEREGVMCGSSQKQNGRMLQGVFNT